MNSALRPSGNPLLDDALDDAYQEDLEKGNLRKRKLAEAPFTPRQWVSRGYWAHVDQLECEACGSHHSQLVGIFHREHDAANPSTIRQTSLNLRAFRNLNTLPQAEILTAKVALCPECVFSPLE